MTRLLLALSLLQSPCIGYLLWRSAALEGRLVRALDGWGLCVAAAGV